MCDTLDLGWTRFTTRILSLPKGVFGFVEDTNIAFVVFPSCKRGLLIGARARKARSAQSPTRGIFPIWESCLSMQFSKFGKL